MKLHHIVTASEAIAEAPAREEKVALLAALIADLGSVDRSIVCTWFQGELRQGRIGVGPTALRQIIDEPPATRHSLRVAGVDQVFTSIEATAGRGSAQRRQSYLRELLAGATEPEQRFLIGLLMGELRQGPLDGLLVDAIALGAGVKPASVRRAQMLTGDIRTTARVAFDEGEKGLAEFRVEVFRPLAPMLAESTDDLEGVLESLGRVALELKLDGARVQVHRDGSRVRVWSRQLKEVTHVMPEVVEAVKALPLSRCIFDGEVLALDAEGRPHPLKTTLSRFDSRLDVDRARKRLPLSLRIFDCLLLEEQELIDSPHWARTEAIAGLELGELAIERLHTGDPQAARAFLAGAIEAGHPGVMLKDPDSMYEAGRRHPAWLKLVPVVA